MGHWEMIGVYDAETTTYSAFAGTNGASPFTPTANGRIKAFRVVESSQAVTTVMTHAQFKFTCKGWTPNSVEIGAVGSGLHTAPRGPPTIVDWVTDLPINAGVPIVLEGRISSAYTNVTTEWAVYAYIEP